MVHVYGGHAYPKKNENACLMILTETSRQMSHFAHAAGAKTKSQTAQKPLWGIW